LQNVGLGLGCFGRVRVEWLSVVWVRIRTVVRSGGWGVRSQRRLWRRRAGAAGDAAHAGLAGAQQINSDVYGPLTIAVGVVAASAFTVGMAWLGVLVARSGHVPRWSGWLLLVAGLFIGIAGLLVGLLQPIGGLCLLVGGLGIAWLGPRAHNMRSTSTTTSPMTSSA
jgi:hypothetical protein